MRIADTMRLEAQFKSKNPAVRANAEKKLQNIQKENPEKWDAQVNHKTLSYNPSSEGEVMGWIQYLAYTHASPRMQIASHDTAHIINLHQPHQLESKVDTSYNAGTDAITKLGGIGSDVVQGIKGFAKTGKFDAKGMLDSVKKNAGELAINPTAEFFGSLAETSSLGFIKAEDVVNTVNKRMGSVPNPHEEMFFENVEIREFSFQHKLIAFEEKDTSIINRIVNSFKYYASPGLSEKRHRLTYPAQWDIKFWRTEGDRTVPNPYLPEIKRCVLTSVEVNHAASDGWAVHHNGAPADIDLTLSFKELTPVFRDHYAVRARGV